MLISTVREGSFSEVEVLGKGVGQGVSEVSVVRVVCLLEGVLGAGQEGLAGENEGGTQGR